MMKGGRLPTTMHLIHRQITIMYMYIHTHALTHTFCLFPTSMSLSLSHTHTHTHSHAHTHPHIDTHTYVQEAILSLIRTLPYCSHQEVTEQTVEGFAFHILNESCTTVTNTAAKTAVQLVFGKANLVSVCIYTV